MNWKLKVLTGLIYSAIVLLMVLVGLTVKLWVWDQKVLGLNLEEEEVFYCGVTASDYDFPYGVFIKSNVRGESLFKDNCAACHGIQEVVVGPALINITQRRSRDWIHKFVSNSAGLVASGDPEAVKIFNEYEQMQMPAFGPDLTRADVDSILNYIDEYSRGIPEIPFPVE